ncbi:MAG: hypothetical protein DWQ36_02055 [Acidobacteria bacterium]|nr:MAG: hypothetical protein DWQ30_23445 [Acidobacteriota bacterium]REK11236.1 MAG: hypothetical protein DWQ36_02055 [Acidobacteriota bacterium]
MSPETGSDGARARWERVERCFDEWAGLESAEQQRALRALRAEDPELAEEVARLLVADRDLDADFLSPRRYGAEEPGDRAAGGAADSTRPQPSAGRSAAASGEGWTFVSGSRIGAFVVERPLGRGGMGEVYLGRRAVGEGDERFAQQVALKIVQPLAGAFDPDLRRRFLRERRILARLDHPGIARLVDGGTTDGGVPYFAMELVSGEPITAYCERVGTSVDQIVELFLAACRAVQYAHENLVVHRDLKPSNVLVAQRDAPSGADSSGSSSGSGVRVKLLDFGIAGLLERDDGEQPLTRTGRAPATPEYAAPEQLRGAPVSLATDVFSLGVVLYELLAGSRPADWPPRGPDPSSGLAPPRPSQSGMRVPRDLDAIVQRCLEEEPARRYGSVAELITDLEAFRGGRPVSALRGNRWYRARKFAWRHRVALSAGVLVAVVFAAGVWGTWSQSRQAQRNAARTERVVQLLTEIFEGNDPARARGEQVTAVALLDAGAARVADDLAEEPEVRAEIEQVLGRLYRSLGAYDDSERLLSSAVALRHALGQGAQAAAALVELARLRLEVGEAEAARRLAEEARLLLAGAAQPSRPSADVGSVLGLALLELGEGGRALEELEDAYEQREAIAAPPGELAQAAQHLADAVLESGDLDRAETLYREAIDSWLLEVTPPDPGLARSWNDLGVLLVRRGEMEEAAELLRRALEARRQVYGESHAEVAHSLRNLAGAERGLGNSELALEMLEQALAIYRQRFGDLHPDVAETYNNLAVARSQAGDVAGAVDAMRSAIATLRQLFGDGHPGLILPLSSLGSLLVREERSVEALPVLEQARQLSLAELPAEHPHRALVAHNLASALLAQQRFDVARPLLEEALAGFEATLGPGHPNVGIAALNLGRSLFEVEPARAAGLFDRAVELLREAPPQTRVYLLQALEEQARVRLRDGGDGAVEPLVEAVRLALDAEDRNTACALRPALRQAVLASRRPGATAEEPDELRRTADQLLAELESCGG